jgi:hypothetical protein
MKPFRRRRISRYKYYPVIGFTEEPPLLLRRKRAGLPRYEDRILAALIVRDDGSVDVRVLFDPHDDQKQKARLN